MVGFFARPPGIRRGLVGLLLLALLVPAYAQSGAQDAAAGGTALAAAQLPLKSAEEVLSSRCTRIHEDPLSLLFLLPGLLFLLFALTFRRRHALLIFLIASIAGAAILGASGEPSGGSAGELVREAERAFAAGQVDKALELYAQAGSVLPCSPALQHNLGVCHAASGRIGYAVYYLRKSLRFRPADETTRHALAGVEKRAGLEGQLPLPVPVNPDVLYVMTLVLANLSLGAGAFLLRRRGVRTLIVMILLAIAAGICLGLFLALLHSEGFRIGVVVAEDVGLMRIPENDARSSFVLPPGTSLRIRGQAGEYYLVETASRFRGWVRVGAILLD